MLAHTRRLRLLAPRCLRHTTTAARRFLSTETTPCSTPEEDFKMFAKIARGNPSFFKDAIAIQQQIDPQLNMVALELALDVDGIRRSVKWPTFILGPKQDLETQHDVYFHRFGGFEDIRYERTLERLKENDENRTCWMGTSGIGKCELLISFLSFSVLIGCLFPLFSHSGELHPVRVGGQFRSSRLPKSVVLSKS
jgi:hypothetical protein